MKKPRQKKEAAITIPLIEQTILAEAQKEVSALNTSLLHVLGELFYPFAGVDCPVIWSMGNTKDSAADNILTAMLIHFTLPENLAQLPENYHKEAPLLLGYLIKQMEVINKYSRLASECANLHKVSANKVLPGHTLLGDFDGWYFSEGQVAA